MLWALAQFGSDVSDVKSPSPATARMRRSEPRTALSKRVSSQISSTSSAPDTTTSGVPIMSSQKIGPCSRVICIRLCSGVSESTVSMLPTTGLPGGCGIGASAFLDAMSEFLPCTTLAACLRNRAAGMTPACAIVS